MLAATCALPVAAHRPSYQECLEASDFIGNAARSRNNGITRDEFLGQMRQEIEAILSAGGELVRPG